MQSTTITLNEQRNVTLETHLLSVGGEFGNIPKRPAVLILPGGGYQMCSDREAEPIALEYMRAGYHTFILRYSLQKDSLWPNPLEDYEQAISLIREKADEWNLYPDKVAVIGFSAGGHLAACAATMAEHKPDAAILGYPVILESSAHTWSATAPDAAAAVNSDTCPCFIFATRDDSLVPVDNSLEFACALSKNNISFETHIYAYGPHGISTAASHTQTPGSLICSRAHHWVDDSIEWLKDMFGDFGNGSMTEPTCGKHLNGNSEDFLSIDCTMGYLSQFPEAAGILSMLMQGQGSQANASDAPQMADTSDNQQDASNMMSDMSPEQIQMVIANMTIRSMLSMGGAPAEALEGLNAQLSQIPNKH